MAGFAERERARVRASFFPTFEWVDNAQPSRRNRMRVPLARARIGLISTSGAYAAGQARFSQGTEGDGSHRTFGLSEPVRFSHGGYDTRRAYRDPEVVLPRRTLAALADEGVLGSVSDRVFALMGYIPDTSLLLSETAPEVAQGLIADGVDLALLVPT